MKWIESDFLTPISIGIIECEKSYWANHFYSVLSCINSHKNLRYSPRQLQSYPLWALNDMRGFLPLNFFETIQDYLYNWGFQYFLSVFLNQKASFNIVSELISRLSNIYGVNFSPSLQEFSFLISGQDSSLNENLQDYFTDVFPSELRSVKANTKKLIDESDLCLILKNPETTSKVAIFGEVEGVHGNKLRNKSYWEHKQDFCVFSFGVVNGIGKQCFVENINVNGIDRVCFHFEQKNSVVQDFHFTLDHIRDLFLHGPSSRLYTRNEEFDFFINLIKSHWFKPAEELLQEISRFIDGSDLVGQTPRILSIITDIQA